MTYANDAIIGADQPAWEGHLRNGKTVTVRPFGPDDARLERDFLARLSQEAVDQCFLGVIKPNRNAVADELAKLDRHSELAILALVKLRDKDVVIGSARYRADPSGNHCDCAVVVDPAWRQQGVGRILMKHLIGVARTQGVRRMYAIDAARCAGAHALAGYLGFHSAPDPEDPASITYELELDR